ncbi:acyl-CoA dehydrogenase family protein (plasmid) [Rhodococcus pyridinivorans]|uniref:acyl-CoA dehydrogenase family protein n=1 Tax=Rhodococcus TaxID=1827 RepID=UPI0007DA08DD|nr:MULTISPECIES: acyl-CoA dehydrogenase family protein [Rhodococcus]MCT7293639.1 acyl-CoA dehydrogenase family protein [Rhodococcus sp. PAE-6]QXU56422.1 acyl-CoA dehydrogenase family protein [Rhodococcus sp. LW-XY12]UQB75791.1 acyl-CoA dehydrogenase family protein [Rhodococcus ruber]UVT27685.1 acyl-CoA dehydrogenase family protein [Rhodococcus pyridinivorans]WML66456.1 acyl-CoA dehydrogenase family protein [Rhodococcus sp. AH-ZY2]
MSAADELRATLARILPPSWTALVAGDDREGLDEMIAATDPAEVSELVRMVARDGWLVPEWPCELGGRALGADETVDVRRELARWRVGTVESAIGTGWVGPAILKYASSDVAEELLPPIARNEALWCQLFSEPDAGSDLAAVRTRATRDGDVWTVTGRKIWTSRADRAGWGLAVARTDASVPKHAGLTCFLVDMRSAGVSFRPIRQMTGDAEFFEVNLGDVRIPDRYRLGEAGQGWEVVRAVLALERVAGSGAGAATPGSMVGRPIEELVSNYLPTASELEADRIARLWVESRAIAFNNRRHALHRTENLPPVANGTPYNKVMQAEHTKRLQRAFLDFGELGLLAHAPDARGAAYDVWAYLRVQPKTVAGGTSEVLRDQIAERGLGMPRGTDPSRTQSWRSFIDSSGASA